MFQRILVVCVGNICRSPAAEGFLKKFLSQIGKTDCQVASAGISAVVDSAASPHSVTVMTKRGIDISSHIARQLTPDMMLSHDLILVMETDQKKFLEQSFPFARGKVHLVGKFQNRQIEDPYLKPIEAFEKMANDLEICLNDWVKHCWNGVGSMAQKAVL